MAFEEFQEFRKILCVCPDCGKIVRLSDLKLKTKTETENTWLDYYEFRERLLSNREAAFDAVKGELREAARAEGRKQADAVFNQAIKQDFRRMNFDPSDIKPVLNPIDFVVFQDMNKSEKISDLGVPPEDVSSLVFISRILVESNLYISKTQIGCARTRAKPFGIGSKI